MKYPALALVFATAAHLLAGCGGGPCDGCACGHCDGGMGSDASDSGLPAATFASYSASCSGTGCADTTTMDVSITADAGYFSCSWFPNDATTVYVVAQLSESASSGPGLSFAGPVPTAGGAFAGNFGVSFPAGGHYEVLASQAPQCVVSFTAPTFAAGAGDAGMTLSASGTINCTFTQAGGPTITVRGPGGMGSGSFALRDCVMSQ